jgi:hypothetical protein
MWDVVLRVLADWEKKKEKKEKKTKKKACSEKVEKS